MRTTHLARFMAIAIIALGISLFSAPFLPFRGADIAVEHVLHADDAQRTVVQDAASVAVLMEMIAAVTLESGLETRFLPEPASSRALRVLVLRI